MKIVKFFLSFPKSFFPLCSVECAERFSYYAMCSGLMLFFAGYGYSRGVSAEYVHYFIILYFCIMLLAGYVADFIDNRIMLAISLSLFSLGHILIFYAIKNNNNMFLLLSVILVALGGGITKPANSVLLGDQYASDKNESDYRGALNAFYYLSNIFIIFSLLLTPSLFLDHLNLVILEHLSSSL